MRQDEMCFYDVHIENMQFSSLLIILKKGKKCSYYQTLHGK